MAVAVAANPKVATFVAVLQARPVPVVVTQCLDAFVVRTGEDLAHSQFSAAAKDHIRDVQREGNPWRLADTVYLESMCDGTQTSLRSQPAGSDEVTVETVGPEAIFAPAMNADPAPRVADGEIVLGASQLLFPYPEARQVVRVTTNSWGTLHPFKFLSPRASATASLTLAGQLPPVGVNCVRREPCASGTRHVFDLIPTTLFDLSVRYCFGDRVFASCPVWGEIPQRQLVALHRFGYRAEAHPLVPTGFDGGSPHHPACILDHDRNAHRTATLHQPPSMLVAASLLYTLLDALAGRYDHDARTSALRGFLDTTMMHIADLSFGLGGGAVTALSAKISELLPPEDAAWATQLAPRLVTLLRSGDFYCPASDHDALAQLCIEIETLAVGHAESRRRVA